MKADVAILKEVVAFRNLVLETHDLNRSGKVLCPAHSDHKPSCHIYPDHFKCFSCGAHGDHLDWLKLVHNLSTAEAIKELKRRAGGYIPPVVKRPVKVEKPGPTFEPVAADVLKLHLLQAEALDHIPQAIQGRGFTLDDLRALRFAADEDDAVFPIKGPDGLILALKRRFSEPQGGQRYRYTTPGHGSPAWCSSSFWRNEVEVLIVEGELNGMACYLAHPELAVMGVAGTNGPLHLDALKGRTVYVYGDGDEPGQKARNKWAAQAAKAGAARVLVLDPWPMDACDIMGHKGRTALRELLI